MVAKKLKINEDPDILIDQLVPIIDHIEIAIQETLLKETIIGFVLSNTRLLLGKPINRQDFGSDKEYFEAMGLMFEGQSLQNFSDYFKKMKKTTMILSGMLLHESYIAAGFQFLIVQLRSPNHISKGFMICKILQILGSKLAEIYGIAFKEALEVVEKEFIPEFYEKYIDGN